MNERCHDVVHALLVRDVLCLAEVCQHHLHGVMMILRNESCAIRVSFDDVLVGQIQLYGADVFAKLTLAGHCGEVIPDAPRADVRQQLGRRFQGRGIVSTIPRRDPIVLPVLWHGSIGGAQGGGDDLGKRDLKQGRAALVAGQPRAVPVHCAVYCVRVGLLWGDELVGLGDR